MATTTDLLATHHSDMPTPIGLLNRPYQWRRLTTKTDLVNVPHPPRPHPYRQPTGDHHPGNARRPPGHRAAPRPPPELADRTVLLTLEQAKGLGFGSVLIVDPTTILTTGPLGHNDLYVAMTRAPHLLGILHLSPPPPELAAIRQEHSPDEGEARGTSGVRTPSAGTRRTGWRPALRKWNSSATRSPDLRLRHDDHAVRRSSR